MKVEITDVQRLTLKPGDRLIIRTGQKLDAATAAHVIEMIRARLGVPDDAYVVVLDNGMSAEVVEGL